MTPEDLASFQRDGFLLVRNLLNQQEVDLIRTALETDQSLQEQQIQLNDQNEGQTKLALWSNPGDGTLGMLTRSRRVVETVEAMLGGEIVHYHSKNLVKYPEEGGVWNWHQDYGYWYKDFFLTPDMLTAYFAIDRQTMDNGCIKLLKGLTWPSPSNLTLALTLSLILALRLPSVRAHRPRGDR